MRKWCESLNATIQDEYAIEQDYNAMKHELSVLLEGVTKRVCDSICNRTGLQCNGIGLEGAFRAMNKSLWAECNRTGSMCNISGLHAIEQDLSALLEG